VGLASVVGGECAWWAAGVEVEVHVECQGEQSLHDPLCEAGVGLGEMFLQAHSALEVGEHRLDHQAGFAPWRSRSVAAALAGARCELDPPARNAHARPRSRLTRSSAIPGTPAARSRFCFRDSRLMDTLGKLLRRRRLAETFSTDTDFIFQCSVPGRPMPYKGMLSSFHKARHGAGLDDVTFHALRHTFASILIAQGHDVQFVSRQLGHSKTSTTWDTYVHLFEAQRHAQDARDRLEAEYGWMLGAADA
jgi:Phage integrase family